MAIGLLAALFAGQTIKNSMDQRQRDKLQAGINEQFGFGLAAAPGAPTPGLPGVTGGQPQFNPDGSIGIQRGQQGLFPQQQQGGIPPNPGALFQGASQLFSLPGGAELGTNLMRDALGFQQQNQQQLKNFEQQLLEQGNNFEQRDLEQENQQTFTGLQNQIGAKADLEQERLDRRSRELIAANRLKADAGVDTFDGVSVPQGFYAARDANNKVYVAAAPGSPPYIKAQQDFFDAESTIGEIDQLLTLLEETGTEMFGGDSARFGILNQKIVSGVAALEDLGVLQEGERENIEKSLPNPGSFKAGLTANSTIRDAYGQLQGLFQTKVGQANRKYSLWGLGSDLDTATRRICAGSRSRGRRQPGDQLTITQAPDYLLRALAIRSADYSAQIHYSAIRRPERRRRCSAWDYLRDHYRPIKRDRNHESRGKDHRDGSRRRPDGIH